MSSTHARRASRGTHVEAGTGRRGMIWCHVLDNQAGRRRAARPSRRRCSAGLAVARAARRQCSYAGVNSPLRSRRWARAESSRWCPAGRPSPSSGAIARFGVTTGWGAIRSGTHQVQRVHLRPVRPGRVGRVRVRGGDRRLHPARPQGLSG